jgi:probable phosphoglycerate mutase
MSAKKTIYIIRHGETDYNKQGIIQGGGIDSSLNELGRRQAQQFYQAYHHIQFDRIYTSELKRTHQSVAPFLNAGYHHHILPELNEINWGVFEGLKGNAASKEVYKAMINDWSSGLLDRSVEDGESPNSVFKRQKIGLQKILSTDDQTILICMHGRALRIFLCLLTDTPLREMDQFHHQNLTLYQLEYDGQKFEIINANCSKHLRI